MPVLIPLATGVISGIGALNAADKRKSDERKLAGMQSPTYKPNQSILDFYQNALTKYNTNPTDSAEYKANRQSIMQGTTQGLAASRMQRQGGANIPALIQGQNNSLLKAAVAGEQRKAKDLSVLGQAAQLKAGEEGKSWKQNYLYPFEKNYNLLAMKAAGEAQVQNSSIKNLYNNLSSAATMYAADKEAGGNGLGTKGWNSLFGKKRKGGGGGYDEPPYNPT